MYGFILTHSAITTYTHLSSLVCFFCEVSTTYALASICDDTLSQEVT